MTQIDRRTTSTPLQYALRYASWGWPVFACAPNSKVPPEGSAGFKDATTDAATLRRWWHAESRFNPAVATGTACWVSDVDPRNDGLASLEILIGKHGELPDTLAAKTPSGGFHYFFAPEPRARNTAARLGRGLDTRGAGGYVLVEGATLMAGSYAFLDFDPLTDALPVLAPAPAWQITSREGSVGASPPSSSWPAIFT